MKKFSVDLDFDWHKQELIDTILVSLGENQGENNILNLYCN